jgi:hypothetical protein
MLSVADCRKRARDCMVEAELATDRDGQFQWRVLADLWLMFAEQSYRGECGHNETQNANAVVRNSVVEDGERLRARLDLVDRTRQDVPAAVRKIAIKQTIVAAIAERS